MERRSYRKRLPRKGLYVQLTYAMSVRLDVRAAQMLDGVAYVVVGEEDRDASCSNVVPFFGTLAGRRDCQAWSRR